MTEVIGKLFTIVILALGVSILIMFSVFAVVFFSVAFSDPGKFRVQREQTQVEDALDKVSRLKVDPADPSSPTYGDLVERGASEHWEGQKKGAS